MSSSAHADNESKAGMLLMFATLAALVASNSFLQPYYHHLLDIPFVIQLGSHEINKPILLWINDGLMTIFFFMIGLELKYERMRGQLQDVQQVLLPAVAALGGVVVPVLIYTLINFGHAENMTGWAIPMATDIAFVFGFIAVFNGRLSPAAKVFLLTLAIIDDLAAIIVIALFHTKDLSVTSLAMGTVALLSLLLMNRRWVGNITAYIVVGIILWVSVLKSGVHATLSGVLLAFLIPFETVDKQPITKLIEDYLRPIVSFFIMPIFAFANAGLALTTMAISSLIHPVALGITMGLVFGKPLGVLSFVYAYRWIFSVKLPIDFTSLMIVGFLAGVGFTMSLFIAGLSFGYNETLLNLSRLGILSATAIAMLISGALLMRMPKKH